MPPQPCGIQGELCGLDSSSHEDSAAWMCILRDPWCLICLGMHIWAAASLLLALDWLGDAPWGICPLVSHPGTTGAITIGMHKAEAEVCLPCFLARKLFCCERPADFHCVTETDLGITAGLFSVCDTCFRSVGSAGLSYRRNVGCACVCEI